MSFQLSQKPDTDKAKNIICALVHREGGRFEGKTRLTKAFWRAHVYHYRKGSGLLSKYPIARLPEGPAIDNLDQLLIALEREGRIEITDQTSGRYLETVIILRSEAPTLREDEEDAVSDAIRWVKDKSAAQVADESHKLSWGWQRRRTGDIIDVQFDGLDYEEVEELQAEAKKIANNLSWAKSAARGAFGG
jgi:hypothetical protein